MDPLSSVLRTLHPQHVLFAGLRAGQAWALAFPPPPGIKFNAVVEGRCWLSVEGLPQAIRLTDTQQTFPNWLRVLSDHQLAPAIQAIHADPARRWTVAELAAIARMSRSTLALKFKTRAGLAPLEYITRWRMWLATTALSRGDQTISALAAQLGYLSDSAFSHAFRRVLGQSPRAYRALTQAVPKRPCKGS